MLPHLGWKIFATNFGKLLFMGVDYSEMIRSKVDKLGFFLSEFSHSFN